VANVAQRGLPQMREYFQGNKLRKINKNNFKSLFILLVRGGGWEEETSKTLLYFM